MPLTERYFRALMTNSTDVTTVLSRSGVFIFVGHNVRMVFGYAPEELLTRPLAEFVHPDDRLLLNSRLAMRARSPMGSCSTNSFRLRDGAGRWRIVEVTSCNLLDDPEVRGLVGNIRDVTERVEAERHRWESEALYHFMAEAAPVGMFRTDQDGNILFANGRLAAMTGIPAARILAEGWLDAVHPDDRPRLEEEWARCIPAGAPIRFDCRLLGPEGTVSAFLQTTPMHDATGAAQGCMGSLADTSEYARTVEALQVAEARNQGIVDAAADAILTVDEDGIVHTFNRAAEVMFGIDAVDIAWRPIDRLIPRAALEKNPVSVQQRLGGVGDSEAHRADGTAFPVELSVSTLEVQGRRLSTAIIRDISERRRIEAELIAAKEAAEAADRAKSAFLATMSHELRTPLNAVIGFAQVIEMRMFGADAIDRYADYAVLIRQSGQHLLGIIEDILDTSKIEAGTLHLVEQAVNIAEMVEQSLSLVAMQADRQKVAVTLMLDADLPQLCADELRLRQILVNLLSNAIKFTDSGGQVTVGAARTDDGGLEFNVRDTGVGMAPEDIPKALARFSQVDQSMTRRHEGTGLGLPLTKHLVELHGGVMRIDSALGQGTTVSIRLPAARVL